jgi:anhydro-N-acetylmuramic acid kinase
VSNDSRILAGAMSGTSADGVDVAIVRITGRGLAMQAELLKHHQRPYNAELRSEIFAFRGGEVKNDPLPRLAQLGREISLTYATAVNEALAAAHLAASDLAAVAAHGQTLYHGPPNTIQWLDPSLIAAEVGCAVVSDFRRADLAAGGQGAPLVPFADYILFRHPTTTRVLINIGGIANLTYIPAGCSIDQVVAFDTGPGNCICDWVMRERDPSGLGFDAGGQRAARGTFVTELMARFINDGYFSKHPPKSTDVPEMIELFRKCMDAGAGRSLDDLLATACFLTCATIRLGIAFFDPAHKIHKELIVSGGGTENATLMKLLRIEQPKDDIRTADEHSVPSAAKEALAFALLGAATLDGVTSNIPSATGARKAVVLGSITPKPSNSPSSIQAAGLSSC